MSDFQTVVFIFVCNLFQAWFVFSSAKSALKASKSADRSLVLAKEAIAYAQEAINRAKEAEKGE